MKLHLASFEQKNHPLTILSTAKAVPLGSVKILYEFLYWLGKFIHKFCLINEKHKVEISCGLNWAENKHFPLPHWFIYCIGCAYGSHPKALWILALTEVNTSASFSWLIQIVKLKLLVVSIKLKISKFHFLTNSAIAKTLCMGFNLKLYGHIPSIGECIYKFWLNKSKRESLVEHCFNQAENSDFHPLISSSMVEAVHMGLDPKPCECFHYYVCEQIKKFW